MATAENRRRIFRVTLLAMLLCVASGMEVAATEHRLVYSSEVPDGAPSWGPGGQEIAFVSTKSGDWEVWIVDAWGGEPVNFSQLPDTTDIYPNWSADGGRIAFASRRANGHGEDDLDIWIQDVETRELNCLTEWEGYDNFVAFDPAGERIAFASDRSGETELWVMNLDNPSSPQKLSEGPVECLHPCWSPDGLWIVFDGVDPDLPFDRRLYKVPSGGGSTVELPMGMPFALDSNWSPCGRYLAFAGGDDLVDWDLWLWDFQDEALIQLTDTRFPEQAPVWNDEGSEIAYAAIPGDSKDVWVAYDLPLDTPAVSTSWGELKRRFGR